MGGGAGHRGGLAAPRSAVAERGFGGLRTTGAAVRIAATGHAGGARRGLPLAVSRRGVQGVMLGVDAAGRGRANIIICRFDSWRTLR